MYEPSLDASQEVGGVTLHQLPSDYDLPKTHPLGARHAFQCPNCHGLSYPEHQDPDGDCPYCAEEDDE